MSTVRANAILDASGGNTATINSMTPTADSLQGFRNRIINGDMRIDQRNAGAAVTSSGSFPVDRWVFGATTSGAVSFQQSTSIVPTGFTHSVGVTITTADASIAASDLLDYRQWIEGFNVADLGFGTANAKTVTISFWVRGSVTGTYCVVLGNSSSSGTGTPNRSYVAQYTISSANTWEYKTITIAGDTSGTWMTNNTRGFIIRFGLTAGTDFQQAAGSWGTANAIGSSSQTQLLSTLNATWYITGVQLEVGSVATPFERRPYGTELALCQRYFEKSYIQTDAVGAVDKAGYAASPVGSNTVPIQQLYSQICFAVVKRADPTMAFYGFKGGSGKVSNANTGADLAASSCALNSSGTQGFNAYNGSGGTLTTGLYGVIYHWTASIEL